MKSVKKVRNQETQADDLNDGAAYDATKLKRQQPVARKLCTERLFESPSVAPHVGRVKPLFRWQHFVQLFDSATSDNQMGQYQTDSANWQNQAK